MEFQPAKLIVKQIVRQVAKCTVCGKEGSSNQKCHFHKAALPVSLFSHSISIPSLLAQVISTFGHLIPKFPEVRFHRTRKFTDWMLITGECEKEIRQFRFGGII